MTVTLHMSMPHNLAVLRFGEFITEADYETALEIYATHPNARYGQNLLCDLRAAQDGTVDMTRRLNLQASMDQVLGSGDLPRQIIYLAPDTRVYELILSCVVLWDPHPTVTAEVVRSEAAAISRLNLPIASLDEILAPKT